MIDQQRQSGRTMRMLQHAQELEHEGRAIYIIAANAAEVKRLRCLLPKDTTIKVETPESPDDEPGRVRRISGKT